MECRICFNKETNQFSRQQMKKHRKGVTDLTCLDCARQMKLNENTTFELKALELAPETGDLKIPLVFTQRYFNHRISFPYTNLPAAPCIFMSYPEKNILPGSPWEPFTGLKYFPNFVSPSEAERIMEVVDSHEWNTLTRRRQQFYGQIYFHTSHDDPLLQPERSQGYDISKLDFLRDKFYDLNFKARFFGESFSDFPVQILINEYVDEVGISSHFEDFEAFGEVIASVSLLAPIYMKFDVPIDSKKEVEGSITASKVLLEENSLSVMTGNSRNFWRHGITKQKRIYYPENEEIIRYRKIERDVNYRRVSLTIRHLLEGRRKL